MGHMILLAMADFHFHACPLATAYESIIPALGRCTSLNIPYHNPHRILSKDGLDHIFPGVLSICPVISRQSPGTLWWPTLDHDGIFGEEGKPLVDLPQEPEMPTPNKWSPQGRSSVPIFGKAKSINHFCTATNMFFFKACWLWFFFDFFQSPKKKLLSAVDSPCFILETFQKFVSRWPSSLGSERSRRGRP